MLTPGRRLVAALACRNQGSRLYGKPLQNLDVTAQVRIIDNIVDCLQSLPEIDEVILGISAGTDNVPFQEFAAQKKLRFVVGDEIDVLSRLVECGRLGGATDIFRVTSESPFLYFQPVSELWQLHCSAGNDATFLEDIVDGCGFEIISWKTLEESHRNGAAPHRSEHCSLYIRENHEKYKIHKALPPAELQRRDLRLTVDNPEDLVVCRAVYERFKASAPRIPVPEIIRFLDENPGLKELIAPFTEAGYKTMYRWGKKEEGAE